MPSQYYAIDASTGLIKRALAQAAVTATGYIGTQWDQGGAVITDCICVIQIEAIDVASNDEIYTFRIVGSNVADRSDAQILGEIRTGRSTALTVETVNGAAGQQLTIRFRTEKNDVPFRYIDLHLVAAGTTPSITFGAYISKEMA